MVGHLISCRGGWPGALSQGRWAPAGWSHSFTKRFVPLGEAVGGAWEVHECPAQPVLVGMELVEAEASLP